MVGTSARRGQSQVDTTIVIPAFNEAERFALSLPRLRSEFEGKAEVEVVIVDDGSLDRTSATTRSMLEGWRGARLLRLPWNGGKGAAVRAGVTMASGESVVFMDADLSADLDDLPRLVEALRYADVAVGSRMLADSEVTYETKTRRITSKIFNDAACAIAGVWASDTQCGFKAFRTPTAKILFHLADVDGFAFDVEILALARLLGFRVTEVPVRWVERPGSRVKPIKDPALMLRDVLRTRRRMQRLVRSAGAPAARASGEPLWTDLGTGRVLPDDVVIDLSDSATAAAAAAAQAWLVGAGELG